MKMKEAACVTLARTKTFRTGMPGVYYIQQIKELGAKMTKDKKLLERIVIDPKVIVGKSVIKGTRLTVEYVLNSLAHGATATEIVREYKGVTKDDIQGCILFATKSLENTSFIPLSAETA